MSVSSPKKKKKYVINGEKQCNDMAQQFLIQPLSVSNVLNANVKILFRVLQICKCLHVCKGKASQQQPQDFLSFLFKHMIV